MILIAGVPRSGTSFMGRVFRTHGPFMEPPLFSAGFNPSYKYNLMEPSAIASLCFTGASIDQFRAAFREIESQWKSDNELVIKVPQLSFFPEICNEFSKVILCLREIDELYLRSARGHGMASWLMCNPYFLRDLKDRTLEGLAQFWKKKAEAIPNTSVYKFGDKSSFDSLMSNYLPDQFLIDQAWSEHWKGSRF